MELNFEEKSSSDTHFSMLVDSLPVPCGKTNEDLVELAKLALAECNDSDREDALFLMASKRPDAFKMFVASYIDGSKQKDLQGFFTKQIQNPSVPFTQKRTFLEMRDELPSLVAFMLRLYIQTADPAVTEALRQSFDRDITDALGITESKKGLVN